MVEHIRLECRDEAIDSIANVGWEVREEVELFLRSPPALAGVGDPSSRVTYMAMKLRDTLKRNDAVFQRDPAIWQQ